METMKTFLQEDKGETPPRIMRISVVSLRSVLRLQTAQTATRNRRDQPGQSGSLVPEVQSVAWRTSQVLTRSRVIVCY